MNLQIIIKTKTKHIVILFIVIVIITLWFLYTPDGLLGKADAIGYAICHRISLRSFFMDNRQMPMCARCTGMYLGTACALIYQAIFSRRKGGMPPRLIYSIMIGLAVFWLVDGVNSYMHLFPNLPGLYEPNNVFRLLTGSGIGIVAALLLYPAFQQTFWSDWVPEPAIRNLKQMITIILLALGVDVLVLLNQPYILFGMALISSVFVLVLLTMVYGMLVLIFLKMENRWTRLQDAFLPLAAGLGIAILQVGAMDWIRYILTGSWQGIPLHP